MLILLVWALGGVVALIGAFVWAELASRFPHVGGQYVYLQRAYPPVVGFLYGVALLFIINGGSLAAVSILFASYVDRSFVPLGAAGIRVAAAPRSSALTAVNVVGVRAGKWTNNLLMAAKVVGMLALVALAFGRGAPPASHFDPRPPSVFARRVGAPAVHRAGADSLRVRRLAELREHRRRRSRIRRAISPGRTCSASSSSSCCTCR